MSFWAAVLYGIIQGVTEFLPVSSSGHLKLAHRFGLARLDGNAEQAFDVLLHVASLLAIVVVFRRELREVPRQHPRFLLALLFGVVPAGLVGLAAGDLIQVAGESWLGLGLAYGLTAALLFVAHVRSLAGRSPAGGRAELGEVTPARAVAPGLLQVLALLGGVSRSGATIAGGLMAGLRPETAVAFAFVIGLPLIGGAALKKAWDGGFGELLAATGPAVLVAAVLSCLGVSMVSIVLLKLVVRRGYLHLFAFYCGVLALLCLVMAL